MSIEEIQQELKKIRYQIRILGETIDHERYPVEGLIMSMDWSENQIGRAHDIFEEYDNKLNAKQNVNWTNFELALRNEFNIDYQTVKSIILAFYQNHQWVDVCKGYAMSFEPTTPVEFHRITRGSD